MNKTKDTNCEKCGEEISSPRKLCDVCRKATEVKVSVRSTDYRREHYNPLFDMKN